MKTDLSRIEIEDFLQHHYGLGGVKKASKVLEATSSVYRIETQDQQLILKIYDWQDREMVTQEVALLQHLHQKQIPCLEVVNTVRGEAIYDIHHHPAVVTHFIDQTMEVESGKASLAQFEMVGRTLAELHIATDGCDMQRHLCDPENLALMLDKLREAHIEPVDFISQAIEEYQTLRDNLPMWDCPRGIIHGDLWPGHLFFSEDGQEVKLILDFDKAGQGYLLFDLASTAYIFWAFDGSNFNGEGFRAILSSYHAVRELEAIEKTVLVDFIAYVALYWTIWRLHFAAVVLEGDSPLDYREQDMKRQYLKAHREEIIQQINLALDYSGASS